MTAPLSNDLRERLIAAVKKRAVAACGGKAVRGGAFIKWVSRWREEGRVDPKPMGGEALEDDDLRRCAQA